MADAVMVDRLRQALAGVHAVEEKRSIGGALAFMVGGHLCVAARKDGIMVRVGPQGYQQALAQPHVTPLAMGGKAPLGYVCVDAEGVRSQAMLRQWVNRGLAFVKTLPPK